MTQAAAIATLPGLEAFMRFLSLGFAALFCVNLFASPGMPKQARFLFSPAEAETVIDLDELDLAGFKVTKCLDLLDVKTGKKSTSMTTALTYSGSAPLITVGKQQYRMSIDPGRFLFSTPGCVLDVKNIRSMQFRFQNTRLPEQSITLQFELTIPYKDVASILMAGNGYRGLTLAYY
jgi:hypothetical protein